MLKISKDYLDLYDLCDEIKLDELELITRRLNKVQKKIKKMKRLKIRL